MRGNVVYAFIRSSGTMFYGNEAKPGLRKTRAAIQICAIHPPPVHECEYVCDQNTRGRHVHVLVRWAIKEIAAIKEKKFPLPSI